MTTFLLTLAAFGILVLAMAVGVIFTGKRLSGSCGGTGAGCTCSPTKQRECKEKGVKPHADTPIDPRALARK